MRGTDYQQSGIFSYISAERRVPKDHPLRAVRAMVDVALRNMGPQFDAMYAKVGRPSIPPEHLLRALLLQVLYSVRSERMLMEQLEYNLLFRWFVAWRWTTRCRRRPPSPRTEIGCWRATSPVPSLKMSSPKPVGGACCRPSTSPS